MGLSILAGVFFPLFVFLCPNFLLHDGVAQPGILFLLVDLLLVMSNTGPFLELVNPHQMLPFTGFARSDLIVSINFSSIEWHLENTRVYLKT